MRIIKTHSNALNIVVRKSLNDKDEGVLFFQRIGEIQKEDNCIFLYDYSGEFRASIPDTYIISIAD